jgi:hypothetical protein
MVRKALLCSGLVMMLAGSFFAQTEGWKKYSNAAGNFTVLFPHDPQDSVIEPDTQWESHTLMTVAPPNVYGVVYNFSKQEQKVDDLMFEIFKSRILRKLPNCEIGEEKPASPALGGYIGRWYRLNCGSSPNKTMGVCNFYWGKHYAYAVVVTFPADAKEPAAGNKFFESFSLIDAYK